MQLPWQALFRQLSRKLRKLLKTLTARDLNRQRLCSRPNPLQGGLTVTVTAVVFAFSMTISKLRAQDPTHSSHSFIHDSSNFSPMAKYTLS